MIKVLTVDDEPKNLRILKELINGYCPQAKLVGEADNIDSAIILIREWVARQGRGAWFGGRGRLV